MKSLFTLPKTPIDQYSLEWYSISVCRIWCCINHKEAIYHINTPWETVGSTKGGVPLIDTWQILKDGSFVGRCDKWEYLGEDNPIWEDCFLTKDQAIKEATHRLKAFIQSAERGILRMEELLAELKNGG